tara:strand:+ start:2034 stop:2291 length:258 start_codon:yes stop_codon:yes gene_type:complete
MDPNSIFLSPIVPLFVMLMLIASMFLIIAFIVDGEVIISPVKGFMIGALVHNETFEENNQEVTEYTLQCLLGIISVNVIWQRQSG